MKLSQVKDYKTLVEYVKQNSNLKIINHTPHPPYNPVENCKLLIHYKTPIAYIIGEEIYTPHYIKENFISMTTAKISTQLCEFSHVLDMYGFIYTLYDELGCSIIEKNRPFYTKYLKDLIGE